MSKTSKAKTAKSARRREELRRNLPKPGFHPRMLLERPEVIHLAVILLAFVAVVAVVLVWSREEVKLRDGRIMSETRVTRVAYAVPDVEETEARREEARKSAPQVWVLNASYLDRLAAALNGLPKAVAGKTSIDEISPALRTEFALSDAAVAAMQAFTEEGETIEDWQRWVDVLVHDELPRNPLLTSEDYQTAWTQREYSVTLRRVLRLPDDSQVDLRADAHERRPDNRADLERIVFPLVRDTGFPAEVASCVTARLLQDSEPTLRFNARATAEEAERAASNVRSVYVSHEKGEVLFRRGDLLTARQYDELLTERGKFFTLAGPTLIWLPRVGLLGIALLTGLVMATVILAAYPRITRNALRGAGICSLMAGMLAISAVVTVQAPNFVVPAAIAPTLVVAILIMLAYDRSLAVFLVTLQAALVTLALEQGIGMFFLLVAGCVTFVFQLREVRNRTSLTKAAVAASIVLGLSMVVVGVLEVPFDVELLRPALNQILIDALYALLAAVFVGFLVLGMLPSIERVFDITTGMTLAELRDPKQPLLRQLQQKAPGTYNHSLQVANIAEAAADAIGADSLLVYVGALYHDIGKMNKPEYFVENQASGRNKHEKLSPAMSLLIIVGHVKDGVELAREYNLPRSILHFIESHHGTTLVEYFFHAAKSREELDKGSIDEVEFRYPGPKPRTREASILMLADAVESAARAMSEPNPGRIEGLVREISGKRLLDGQFDQSELSFRDLTMIEDAMIQRLRSIYHGRITYPSKREREAGDEERVAEAKPA